MINIKTYVDTPVELSQYDALFPDAYFVLQHGLGPDPTSEQKFNAMKKVKLDIVRRWLETSLQLSSMVYAFHKADNNKFYADQAFTQELVGNEKNAYVDIGTNKDGIFRFESNIYVKITNFLSDELLSAINSHISSRNNPHEVTKTQVGLGNVENKSSAQIRSEITVSDIPQLPESKVTGLVDDLAAKYTLPELGIPEADLSDNVIGKLNRLQVYKGGYEPTDPDVLIWIRAGLTPEQIEALNNMTAIINGDGTLSLSYDGSVLDFNFAIINGNLIVDNGMSPDVDFNIVNNNLEVTF